jgi:hypothetical protein
MTKAYLKESVGHASTDDHLVDLGEEVLDELNLVRHLGASEDGEHRALGVVKNLEIQARSCELPPQGGWG